MRKIIFLFIIIFNINNNIFSNFLKNKNGIYEFKIGNRTLDKKFEWNLFYPTYYLYTIFHMIFELDNQVDISELKSIAKSSIKLLSQGYQSQIIIKNYYKKQNLEITMTPRVSPKNDNEYYILIISNFDFKKNKIVSGDDMKNAFANFILLKDDKWVKNTSQFNEEEVLKLKNENKINNLCDLYLLDEVKENDTIIENLLLENIKNSSDIVEKYFSIMTLIEYYLFSGEYNKGLEQIKTGEIIYNEIPTERQKNIKILIKFNYELLDYIKFIRSDENFWKEKASKLFNIN